jgi:hypothetical protein
MLDRPDEDQTMTRTADVRPVLIDPAAPRRTPRERVAARWFGRPTSAGTRTLVDHWDSVHDTTAAGQLAAA